MNSAKSNWLDYLQFFSVVLIAVFLASAADGRETKVLHAGKWKSDSFFTTLKGSWQIVREGETIYLQLGNNFNTTEGPDLKIFLSKLPLNDIRGDNAAKKETSFRVGELKAFRGKSTYVIPDDIAIDDYKSVVIHCEAYSKLWGGSPIDKVGAAIASGLHDE